MGKCLCKFYQNKFYNIVLPKLYKKYLQGFPKNKILQYYVTAVLHKMLGFTKKIFQFYSTVSKYYYRKRFYMSGTRHREHIQF